MIKIISIGLLCLLFLSSCDAYSPPYRCGVNVCPQYWKDKRTGVCFAYIVHGSSGTISFTSVDCAKVELYLD